MTTDADRITRAAARFVMNNGSGNLYVLDGDRERMAANLARALAKLEGVSGAWTSDQCAALGFPGAAHHPHVGDVVVVRSGEIVPVDGLVESAGAVLDESALTGEPMPRMRSTRSRVASTWRVRSSGTRTMGAPLSKTTWAACGSA